MIFIYFSLLLRDVKQKKPNKFPLHFFFLLSPAAWSTFRYGRGRTAPADRNKEEAVSYFNKFNLMGKIYKEKKKKIFLFFSFFLFF
jgi:hypothetical protein